MPLDAEIEKAKRSVITDAYQMSVGEIINLYKDSELIINPNFQRLYRWELYQKSRLIESILLGIPLPSIFVFETEQGQWELVDGLQRVSTLLEFMGLLNDPDTRKRRPPIALVGTKYLPSLSGAIWEENDHILPTDVEHRPLDRTQQLSIRRSRLSVEILKQPSDVHTKYDLFQRLNAGGTVANPQELRNCIVVMANEPFFQERFSNGKLRISGTSSKSRVFLRQDSEVHRGYSVQFRSARRGLLPRTAVWRKSRPPMS